MTNGDKSQILDDLRTWRETGNNLRSLLEARRDELQAELAEITGALATIPGEPAAAPEVPEVPEAPVPEQHLDLPDRDWIAATRSLGLSAPDLVLAVLARTKRHMNSMEIWHLACKIEPKLTMGLLHSGIYRLTAADRIVAKGTRGTKTYAIRS